MRSSKCTGTATTAAAGHTSNDAPNATVSTMNLSAQHIKPVNNHCGYTYRRKIYLHTIVFVILLCYYSNSPSHTFTHDGCLTKTKLSFFVEALGTQRTVMTTSLIIRQRHTNTNPSSSSKRYQTDRLRLSRTFQFQLASKVQQPTSATSDNQNLNGSDSPLQPPPISLLNEVDVRHGTKTQLVYDPIKERYIDSQTYASSKFKYKSLTSTIRQKSYQTISNAFLPEGVTPSYYKFIQWRIIQRFINANVHVFGTQSLLMGLGLQSKSAKNVLGLSAALNWVLKDALGKIVRMLWASKMGRKFDPDAKRWRYRSSLLFALGNGLEVMTYVFPSLFLVLATMANSFKQMSMLTSSATRNAIYNSFRDGSKENIGDITAKGEAQIAIVDLFGIISGVLLSRAIGTSVQAVLSVWITLQILEVTCVYKQIRAVVFRTLNFERLWKVTNHFLDEVLDSESTINGKELRRSISDIAVPTPDIMAKSELIFLPPNHLARRAISFGSFGRAKLAPEELSELMDIFAKEKFLLVVGKDVKNNGRMKWVRKKASERKHSNSFELAALAEQMKQEAMENCHIVLHAEANNADIVKSTLALAILRRNLSDSVPSIDELETLDKCQEDAIDDMINTYSSRRSRDVMDLIRLSREQGDQLFGTFLKVLSVRQWATPARFMFGRVSMRAEWPIRGSGSKIVK